MTFVTNGTAGNPKTKLSENESYTQLQMVWPEHLLDAPPAVGLPPGYTLRTYRQGDEPRFYEIMELAGWPGWDDEVLWPWLSKILPEGWFMAIHEESSQIVATAMALHNLAGVQELQGRRQDARKTLERAVAVWSRSDRKNSIDAAASLAALDRLSADHLTDTPSR